MDYTTLGKTGLRVSVAGLGSGGNSRLGLGAGRPESDCIALIREALELGVNFFDTAEVYGTEELLGRALAGVPREDFVISTKSRVMDETGSPLSVATVLAHLDGSLRRLGLSHVDVYHLHAVPESHYEHARDVLAPALLREKAKGKIRHLGITETPPRDPGQRMLSRALNDPCWEVIMLAFHMMNQGARSAVFPRTRERGIGTLLMFVVRNIFSRPGVLQDALRTLAAEGRVPRALADDPDPLGFLIREGGAASLTDAAYRFARHEPGVDVVLFGTGDIGHLRANIASLLAPPLPPPVLERLHELFGALQGVGLVLPDNPRTLVR